MIRRLGPGDLAAWRAFRRRMLVEAPETFDVTPAEYDAVADAAELAWLGRASVWASGGASLTGTSAWAPREGERYRHRGYLDAVYVVPGSRGQGLAERLVTACIDEARGRVAQLELVVTSESVGAIRLYRRLGFVVDARVPRGLRIDGRDVEDTLMRLDLDPPS
jgi:ribosomal protein S18 acetylase RimI-like enzyme